MSVANLTRYTVFQNEHCDWNCGLMPQHDGPLVKFEEVKADSSNSLQQLKDEILPTVKDAYAELTNHNYGNTLVMLNKIIAKLSAI